MKMTVTYLEHQLDLSSDKVFSCEIENRNYFYRLVQDLCTLNEGLSESIRVYDENTEINLTNKLNIIVDFFDFGLDSKKIQGAITKYIIKNLTEDEQADYNKIFNTLLKRTNKVLNKIDMDLEISENYNIETLIKLLKIIPKEQSSILDKILSLIDIFKCLQNDEIIVFINLKQYLSKNELEEVYKYAIYNEITILLIDSISTGISIKRERKLIIDCDLQEYMLS